MFVPWGPQVGGQVVPVNYSSLSQSTTLPCPIPKEDVRPRQNVRPRLLQVGGHVVPSSIFSLMERVGPRQDVRLQGPQVGEPAVPSLIKKADPARKGNQVEPEPASSYVLFFQWCLHSLLYE
jgi:hypothetical protein